MSENSHKVATGVSTGCQQRPKGCSHACPVADPVLHDKLTKVPATDQAGRAISKVHTGQVRELTPYFRIRYAELIANILSCCRHSYCLTGQVTYSQGLFPAPCQGIGPYSEVKEELYLSLC